MIGIRNVIRTQIEIRRDLVSELGDRLDLPPVDGADGLNYVFCIQSGDRDGLRQSLAQRGVETGIYYSVLLPNQPAFGGFDAAPREFPNAARIADRHLALPLYPELTDDQVDHVIQAVLDVHDDYAVQTRRRG